MTYGVVCAVQECKALREQLTLAHEQAADQAAAKDQALAQLQEAMDAAESAATALKVCLAQPPLHVLN